MARLRLGVDIGGTGTKAGLVDFDEGILAGERRRVATPQPSTPQAVAEAVAGLCAQFDYSGAVGIGFPSVVVDGVVWTANNIDKSWIGVDAGKLFTEALNREITLVNDADAAALCEGRYGAAREVPGVVLVITFGTGIGSGMLHDGRLVPNLQIGDLELEGHRPAESYFAASAKDNEGLTWEEWAQRANRFLRHLVALFAPNLIVVGGGVTKKWEDWQVYLDPDLKLAKASRANNAGIIGAATLVG